MELKSDSGYFSEYDCENILDLKKFYNDMRCQMIAYIGNNEMLIPLLEFGVKGIDRISQIGQSMDFSLIWDGYNLYERLARVVSIL